MAAKWYVWDSRGGTYVRPDLYQIVNFDLEKNLATWREVGWATITGAIDEGRITIKEGSTTIEFWREDQPNPTSYTEMANPDPIRKSDGDSRTFPTTK